MYKLTVTMYQDDGSGVMVATTVTVKEHLTWEQAKAAQKVNKELRIVKMQGEEVCPCGLRLSQHDGIACEIRPLQ